MALSKVLLSNSEDVWGGRYRVIAYTITMDTAYPAGGYPISAAEFGSKSLYGMIQIGTNSAASAYDFTYDRQAGTLRAFQGAAEASGNVSGLSVNMLVLGR